MNNLLQISLNIIGGAITIAMIELGKLWYENSIQRKFKALFGPDPFRLSQFHLAYAHLKLQQIKDPRGATVKYPYVKPGEETSGTGFSIDRPVSSCEVRAANYLAATIGKEAKIPATLSPDTEILHKLDLSFVAFGGPLSNYKTRDVVQNELNRLVIFDNTKFTKADTGESVVTLDPKYDYGLILKIHPSQFPDRTWFICAGLGEWGTSGAAWYLANKWSEIYKFAKDRPFAVVVRVKPLQDESATPVYTLSA